ncbi:MAG: carbohydrate kinase [Desulfovibrio sp.]|nr:MAG: carbohydrate kinase [Desulfovibrio sp.]
MAKVPPSHAASPLVLALDVGSSSARAVALDARARTIGGWEVREPLNIPVTREGGSEIDPDHLLHLIFSCVDKVVGAMGARAAEIAAVAGCSFVGNLMGVDETGKPVTTLTTYADTRASIEAEKLRAELDEVEVHKRTGAFLHPSYHPARLRMLARTKSEAYSKAARWITIGEYLEWTLFGEYGVSHSVASWSGLLNRHSLEWDEAMVAASGISLDQLGKLADCSQSRTGLKPEFAARWPGLAKVPWFPFVGDGAAANVGSLAMDRDSVALTMGTSSAMRVVLHGHVEQVPDGLFCYRVDGKRALVGGALNEGGNVVAWLRNTLGLDKAAIGRILREKTPGKHGLTVLPLLAGERSPGWKGSARGAVQGIGLSTGPEDLAAAFLEAVAYRIGLVHSLLAPLLDPEHMIIAGGGALHASKEMVRLVADVLGRPVALAETDEVSARGAAILALEALGAAREAEGWTTLPMEVFHPDKGRHQEHAQAMARQQELYGRLVSGLHS